MHIGILFYSDTIIMARDPRDVKGRAVANNGFIEALLQNAGDSSLSFFVSSMTEKEFLEGYLGSALRGTPVKIVPFLEMPGFLKTSRLDALHVLGPDLYRGLYIRNHISSHPFAVTGVTHSLGHAPFLEWMVQNLLGEPRPYDRLICTSPTAETVVSAMASLAGKGLAEFSVRPDSAEGGVRTQSHLKTEVIPLGVFFDHYQTQPAQDRKDLGLPDSAVVLLSFSRLSYYTKSDLIPLLLIFREVVKRSPADVRLIIAGSTGPENYETLLKAAAEECGIAKKVIFVTNPDESVKRSLFHAADIFVAPNDNPQETFGLTLIEALSSGLPVVASDWNGYRSLIDEGKNGHLIPTLGLSDFEMTQSTAAIQIDSLNHLFFAQSLATDHMIFADRLLDLIGSKEKRSAFAQGAREKGRSFDWKVIISKYFGLWSKLSGLAQREPEGALKTDPSTLNYYKTFKHYAAAHLKDEDHFTTSPLGIEVLTGKIPLRTYTAVEEILSTDLLGKILKESGPGSVVTDIFTKLQTVSKDLVRYHVVWLYKYGLLLKDSDQTSNSLK